VKEHEIVSAVQRGAGLADPASAEKAVRVTLGVLGSRLKAGEGADLAAQLPPALAEALPQEAPGERFGVQELYRRVAEAEGCDGHTARQHARAVGAVLKAALSPGELDDVLSQLPEDYQDLFATSGPVH